MVDMPLWSLASRRVLYLVLLLWALLAAGALYVSASRIGNPFPGFLLSANGFLGATDLADWTGARAGLVPLDHLVAVNGQPVDSANALIARVEAAPAGTPFAYTLADGRVVTVPSMAFTAWEFTRSAFPFWLGAIAHLVFGAWVLLQRPHLPAAVGHWRYCQIFALFLLAGVYGERWPFWNALNLMGCALMLPAIAELVLVFPVRPARARLENGLRMAAWAVGAAICALVLVSLREASLFPLAFNLVLMVPAAALLGALGLWTWQAFFSRLPAYQKGQARMVLAGLGLSLVPSLVYSFSALLKHPLPGFEFAFVGFCAFPAAIALAIVRYQAFDLPYVLRRATFYTLLTAALGGVYLAAATGAHLLLGRLAVPYEGASLSGFAAALAVAAAFRPGYALLQRWVDRWFLGERPDPLDTVAAFTADTERLETEALVEHLVRALRSALGATWVELRWKGRVIADGERRLGEVPASELVLQLQEGPIGTLVVGPRQDDSPYGPQERALLDVLVSQAALAMDRAMLFEARLHSKIGEATALGRAEAREQLLKQVVHDLGTELSNIAVAADLARQMPGEAAPLDSLQASLARIETFLAEKRYRLQREGQPKTPLAAGLDSALATLSPQLAQRRQHLEATVSDRETLVPLSQVELAQVLVNLVGNASKYSPEGSVIRLLIARQARHVVIRVEDDGPGVPALLLDRLGDGRRGHGGVPGQGFGLQNCRALVASAGGTLTWQNGDRGAILELKLPALT